MLQQWHVSCPCCHILGPFLQGLQQADVLPSLQVPKASRDQFKAHSTADGDCSHEIKRCFLLGRIVMTNLGCILKSKDITLLTKVCLVKAVFFSKVVYGCDSWTIREAEHRIDAFELWFWRRLLRVPWTAKRSNQSILKKSVLNIHWKDWC